MIQRINISINMCVYTYIYIYAYACIHICIIYIYIGLVRLRALHVHDERGQGLPGASACLTGIGLRRLTVSITLYVTVLLCVDVCHY